jgi:lysophospholipase
VDRFADYLADVQAIRGLVARNHPGLPCFYLGHSMGGLIVVLRVLDNPSELNGAIVSSPLLAPHPSAEPSPVTKLASGLLSKLAPRMLISSGLDTSALCRDASVVEAYVNDPLVSDKVSARWFTTTMEAAARARQGAPGLKAPVLLMQSGDDRLVAADATRAWAGAAPQKLVEFEWWDGFYHEMFNEPERDRVFTRADRWLSERVPGYHA